MKDPKDEIGIDHLIPVAIGEFINGVTTPVDLYVRLSERKFILVAKAGSTTQKEQLSSFKDRRVDYLWVRKDHFHKVARQVITIAGIVVKSDRLNADQKTQVVSSAAKTVFKQLDQMGISIESYQQAKAVTEVTIALVEALNDVSSLLGSLAEANDDLVRHSMAVSALSVMIAQAMNWENKLTLEKLALGGLLHDVGKKNASQRAHEKTIEPHDTG